MYMHDSDGVCTVKCRSLVLEPSKMQQDRIEMKEVERKIGEREPGCAPHGKRIALGCGGAR